MYVDDVLIFYWSQKGTYLLNNNFFFLVIPRCEYGDLTPRCQIIREKRHLCYLPENQRLCCLTCPSLADGNDTGMYCIKPSNVYMVVLLYVLCIYLTEISFVHTRGLFNKELTAKWTGLKKQFKISIVFEPSEFALVMFDCIYL